VLPRTAGSASTTPTPPNPEFDAIARVPWKRDRARRWRARAIFLADHLGIEVELL
jgi:hypothetical protein